MVGIEETALGGQLADCVREGPVGEAQDIHSTPRLGKGKGESKMNGGAADYGTTGLWDSAIPSHLGSSVESLRSEI